MVKTESAILSALNAIRVSPDQVVEIRALKVPGRGKAFTASGYFDDMEIAAREAAKLEARKPEGIYLTLNQIDPSLLARSANRITDYADTTTADHDIQRRLWLPIDIDPKRPKGISSSDAQLAAAINDRSRVVLQMGRWFGVQPTIRGMSGNGAHLLYRIDVPNDEASKDQIKAVLEALQTDASEGISIDAGVFTAARIWKLYGTTARKGDSVPDRPHRLAVLEEFTPDAALITAEQLAEFSPAKPKRKIETATAKRGISETAETLEAYLREHGVTVRARKQEGQLTILILTECPMIPDHGHGTDTAVVWSPDGLGFKCMHARCSGFHWKDLRQKIDPGHSLTQTAFREIQWTPNFGTAQTVEAPVPAPVPTYSRPKPYVSNIIVAKGDEDEAITIGKNISEIAEGTTEALDGWPRRVSGMLFVTQPQSSLPTMGAVQPLRKQEQLFSWLHTKADVHWPTAIRKGLYSRNQDPISAVTRTEFYEYLSANAKPDYAAVELLPHLPPFPDTFYLPSELPNPTGKCFWEFVDMLNAADDAEDKTGGGTFDPGLDRLLLAAALLTPGWGGEPGQRPAFLFSSKYGRGSGKSKTAVAMMQVWGSWVTLAPDKEDWKEAKSRLMDALTSRCVFIDNIRNRLSGAELESLITAPMIDAKKMYVGHFTRPNRLTFFLTSNTPRLSNDLTERSIPVHIGAPRWGINFDKKVAEFLAKNRAQLLADIFAILAMPPLCEILPENRDRWGSWQDAILTRFEAGNEMAALIKARRPEADADLDDQEELRAAIEEEIEAMCCGDATYQITSDKLLEIMRKHKLIEDKYGVKGMVQMVGGMLGASGPLKRLVRNQNRIGGKRGWLYLPEDPECKKTCEIVVRTT